MLWAPVPEAPVHEHDHLGADEGQVGSTPATAVERTVHPVAEAASPELATQFQLRRGVAARVGAHPFGELGARGAGVCRQRCSHPAILA